MPRRGAFPARAFVPLTAGIVLTHPAHLPAAVTLVVLVALNAPGRLTRIVQALRWLVVAALVTSFWTVPLLARLADTRALAWGTLTPSALGEVVRSHPLVIVLVILALVAIVVARSAAGRVLAWWPWAIAVVVAVDALVLEPLGVRWLPADRVMDSFWLALVLAAGLGAGRLLERLPGRRAIVTPALGIGAALVAVALSLAGDGTLAVWAKPGAWPSYPPTERGLRLPALWAALRTAPAGRVLFVRSGVPLVYGRDWWRPHTHITALTPLRAGRGDRQRHVHSSLAGGRARLPRSDARAARSRSSSSVSTAARSSASRSTAWTRPTFNAYVRRLGVSVVVALDEDGAGPARARRQSRSSPSRRMEPPFILWTGTADQRAAAGRIRSLAGDAARPRRKAGHPRCSPTTRSGAPRPAAKRFPPAAEAPASWSSCYPPVAASSSSATGPARSSGQASP